MLVDPRRLRWPAATPDPGANAVGKGVEAARVEQLFEGAGGVPEGPVEGGDRATLGGEGRVLAAAGTGHRLEGFSTTLTE